MHIVFREFAQQMGMQTDRAILDEDIDICLNAAQIDKIREIILQNVAPTPYQDKVIRQNAVISPINALRTLYSKKNCYTKDRYFTSNYSKDSNDSNYRPEEEVDDWYEITKDTYDNLDNSVEHSKIEKGLNVIGNGSEVDPFNVNISSEDVLLYTGFKVSYNGKSLYDCRIIEAEDLGQTLRDFCNRAAPDAPICTIFGDVNSITVDLYTGREVNTWTGSTNSIKPTFVQYLHIRKPKDMKYTIGIPYDRTDDYYKDNPGLFDKSFVDSELPQYLHTELVERAVSKYLVSIGVGTNRNNEQTNQ